MTEPDVQKMIATYQSKGYKRKKGDTVVIGYCNQRKDSNGKICGMVKSFLTIEDSKKSTTQPRENIKYSNIVRHCKKVHLTRYNEWRYDFLVMFTFIYGLLI